MYAPNAPIPIYAEMSRINISPAGGRPVGSPPNKTPVIIFLISTSLLFCGYSTVSIRRATDRRYRSERTSVPVRRFDRPTRSSTAPLADMCVLSRPPASSSARSWIKTGEGRRCRLGLEIRLVVGKPGGIDGRFHQDWGCLMRALPESSVSGMRLRPVSGLQPARPVVQFWKSLRGHEPFKLQRVVRGRPATRPQRPSRLSRRFERPRPCPSFRAAQPSSGAAVPLSSG